MSDADRPLENRDYTTTLRGEVEMQSIVEYTTIFQNLPYPLTAQ